MILLAASPLLLAGCKPASTPGPEARSPSDSKSGVDADPATVIDLEALSADPAAALPGVLVRHGRYEVHQSMHEGDFVVSMTEALAIHELGGRLVGRIASESDTTPMPPSFLVFVTDDQRRLQHVIWRGLKGMSEVEHEHGWVSFRSDGTEIEIVHPTGPLSSSIRRVKVSEAWAVGGTVALEYLPLWSETAAARPQKAQWVALELQPEAKPARVRLMHQGQQTIAVGKGKIDAWHYVMAGEASPTSEVWVDEQGLVVRRLEHDEGDVETQWETIYVPLPGDPLAR